MKLKKAAVAAAIGLTGTALMACGGKKSEESGTAAGSKNSVSSGNVAVDAAKVEIVSAGKLTMVTNVEFPPYEYHEGNDIKDIDVEICQAVAEKLGLKLEIEDVTFGAIIPEVTPGKADLAAAGMTVIEDRKQNTDFSDIRTSAKQLIPVKDDSTFASKDSLGNKKIGVQQGTTSNLMSTGDFGGDAVVRFLKSMGAVRALTRGKTDAVIVDSQTAEQFVKEVPGIKALDVSYSGKSYVVGVKKGNTELLSAVNGTLSELRSEGKLDEIVTRYTKTE